MFSGVDGSVLFNVDGAAANDSFGFSVSEVGDVDGDGVFDLIVGAPSQFGLGLTGSSSARVISGTDGSTIYTLVGDDDGDNFGASVSGAGDVNGDGIADFIVGAPSSDGSGYARVFVSQIVGVPEPGSATLLAMTALVTVCRRRRSNVSM